MAGKRNAGAAGKPPECMYIKRGDKPLNQGRTGLMSRIGKKKKRKKQSYSLQACSDEGENKTREHALRADSVRDIRLSRTPPLSFRYALLPPTL